MLFSLKNRLISTVIIKDFCYMLAFPESIIQKTACLKKSTTCYQLYTKNLPTLQLYYWSDPMGSCQM
jgi:hypothetical protein